MVYQLFENKNTKRPDALPGVRFFKDGRIFFNKPCMDWLAKFATPKSIELLWDQKKQRVAFRPGNGPCSYKLFRPARAGGQITAKGFVRQIGNPLGQALAELNDTEGLIVVSKLPHRLTTIPTTLD